MLFGHPLLYLNLYEPTAKPTLLIAVRNHFSIEQNFSTFVIIKQLQQLNTAPMIPAIPAKYSILIAMNGNHASPILKSFTYPACEIIRVTSAADCINLSAKKKIDILIVNQQLPDGTGLSLLKKIKKAQPDVAVILLLNKQPTHNFIETMNQGQIQRLVTGPFTDNKLQMALSHALEVIQLKERNEQLISELAIANLQLKKVTGYIEKQPGKNKQLPRKPGFSTYNSHEKETLLQPIFDLAAVGIGITSREGLFLRLNKHFTKITGYTEAELYGRSFKDITHPDDLAIDLAEMAKMEAGLIQTFTIEKRYIKKNRDIMWVTLTISAIKDEGGMLIQYIGVIEDITKRKEAEDQLQQEQMRYQDLVNSIDGIVWESFATDFHFSFVSPQAEKMTGFPLKQWLKEPNFWSKHIHPEDRSFAIDFCNRSIERMQSHTLEYRFIKANRQVIWIRDIITLVAEPDKPVMLRGVMLNITKQRISQQKIEQLNIILEKKIEQRTKRLQVTLQALRNSEQRYRNLFWNSNAVMLFLDPLNALVVDANPAACRYYGYPREKMIGMKVADLNTRSEAEVAATLLQVRSRKQQHFEFKHKLAGGEVRDVEVYTGPINKERDLLFSIVHDISKRKKAEEELKRSYETQKVLLREVNHRVKNNLAALISLLHIEEDRWVKVGNTSGLPLLKDLTHRIQGLLIVHQLFSARNWQPIELSQLCYQIIQGALQGMPLGKEYSITIKPSRVLVNSSVAHHITLIINELATNTLKHALHKRKHVSITVSIHKKKEQVELIYHDNGPGFPDNMLNGKVDNANIGFELIRGIVTQSLEGRIRLSNNNGAVVAIHFINQTE